MSTIDELLAAAEQRITRFSPRAALEAMTAGAVLVDTRCDGDRVAEGIVPDSVHAPRSVLEWRADPTSEHHDPALTTADRLIVMCNDGFSSCLAAASLTDLGHRAGDVIGGFRAWQAAGLPVLPHPASPADR